MSDAPGPRNRLKDKLARGEVAASMTVRLVRDASARTIAACRAHGKHVGVGGLGFPLDATRQARAVHAIEAG